MKYLLAILLITNIASGQSSNIKWTDPAKMTEQCIDGRGWNDGYTFPYDRLPQKAQSMVRPVLWDLSKHTAGEYINFTTNSSTIYVRLKVKGAQAMTQMPATGVSGVDLYSKDHLGVWNWTKATVNFKDTITYKFKNINDPARFEFFRLYLPLCNAVSWLEIGIPENSTCTLLPAQNDKPIVAYGTSIMHGAFASRYGIGWTNILGRKLNSKMKKEGIKDIYELTASQIGFDTESTLDGTHPNDIGMMQYTNAYYQLITRKIGLS